MRNLLLSILLAGSALAGETSEPPSAWSGEISAGWDSLYMFRGVNQLPGYAGYGSGISWTALSLTWSPTANDSFTIGTWTAFGVNASDYKEFDATLSYTRTLGDLSLSAGYSLYAVLSDGTTSNELNISAAYDLHLGPVKITPMIDYIYTLGPEPGQGGYVPADAGYLEFRIDGEIPLHRDILRATPWIAAGFNFGYNASGDDIPQYFNGADHLELGLSLPFSVTRSITVSPYGAYSHAWRTLYGTSRDTFWGGVAVTFSF